MPTAPFTPDRVVPGMFPVSPLGWFGMVGGLTVPGLCIPWPVMDRWRFVSGTIRGLRVDRMHPSRDDPAATWAQSNPGGNLGSTMPCADAAAGIAIKAKPRKYLSFIAPSFRRACS
jgi:hypothetical protein